VKVFTLFFLVEFVFILFKFTVFLFVLYFFLSAFACYRLFAVGRHSSNGTEFNYYIPGGTVENVTCYRGLQEYNFTVDNMNLLACICKFLRRGHCHFRFGVRGS
jgi:hypothetical protein